MVTYLSDVARHLSPTKFRYYQHWLIRWETYIEGDDHLKRNKSYQSFNSTNGFWRKKMASKPLNTALSPNFISPKIDSTSKWNLSPKLVWLFTSIYPITGVNYRGREVIEIGPDWGSAAIVVIAYRSILLGGRQGIAYFEKQNCIHHSLPIEVSVAKSPSRVILCPRNLDRCEITTITTPSSI